MSITCPSCGVYISLETDEESGEYLSEEERSYGSSDDQCPEQDEEPSEPEMDTLPPDRDWETRY